MRHFKECQTCSDYVNKFFNCENCKIAKEKDEKNSRVSKELHKGNAGRDVPDTKRGAVSLSLEKEVR